MIVKTKIFKFAAHFLLNCSIVARGDVKVVSAQDANLFWKTRAWEQRTYLDEGVEQQRVDFPVVAQAEQTSEQSTHYHSKAQVVAQRETLAKDTTVKTSLSFFNYPQTSKQAVKKTQKAYLKNMPMA